MKDIPTGSSAGVASPRSPSESGHPQAGGGGGGGGGRVVWGAGPTRITQD